IVPPRLAERDLERAAVALGRLLYQEQALLQPLDRPTDGRLVLRTAPADLRGRERSVVGGNRQHLPFLRGQAMPADLQLGILDQQPVVEIGDAVRQKLLEPDDVAAFFGRSRHSFHLFLVYCFALRRTARPITHRAVFPRSPAEIPEIATA